MFYHLAIMKIKWSILKFIKPDFLFFDMDFLRRKLKNGITVIMEKRELPVVAVSISNPFGGAFESAEIKGAAHVIEHMLFTGTQTRSHEDISREIEKRGGILNAFTDHDVTSYWFKLPSEHLFSGLDILIDMLNDPKFDNEKFEKEKKVILEEIKLYHDDPKRNVYEQIEKNLFESPFGNLIIGDTKSVSSLKRDFVYSLFKKNYNPGNFIVTIIGNADFDKVCDYLGNNFKIGSGIPKSVKIITKNSETTEERMGIDQANFVIAMHAPLPRDKNFYSLEVLNSYLADGMSSRLFLEIREKRGLAYTVRGNIHPGKNHSFYSIYVGTTKQAIKEVKEIIISEFNKIKDITEKEIDEAKETLIGLKKISSEESANVMNELLYHELFIGAESYYKYEENIRNVKIEDVKELASRLIKKYSVASIVPK
jgi:predicted Zn-dependent peptidase